jgi:hypothetical protein
LDRSKISHCPRETPENKEFEEEEYSSHCQQLHFGVKERVREQKRVAMV